MTNSIATLPPPVRDKRTVGAFVAITLGTAMTLMLALAADGLTLIPMTVGLAVALAVFPFPTADRLLGLSLIGTMPLVWSDPLPNVPLAAGVLVIALLRIGPVEARCVPRRAWIILAASWAPLIAGAALADWPPISVWLRPAALLGLGGAAAILGLLVWRNPRRRQLWLEGITLGLLITAASGLVVFSLQLFLPFSDIVHWFADLQALLRGTSAGETFRDQNNWLIPGAQVTLRAISPLFPSPNNLGAYVGVTAPIAFMLSLNHPSPAWRIVARTAAALAVAVAVLTLSRSTWLATAVAGTLMVGVIAFMDHPSAPRFGVRRDAIKLGLILAAVALVALVVAAAAGGDDVIDRVLNPLEDESVTDRLDTNDQALRYIAANPLRGVGLGNWRATIADQQDVAYVHNVYIEYSAAVGLLGGFWAVMVIAVPFAAGVILLRREPSGRTRLLGVVVMAISAFAAVHFMFDDNLLNPQYAWLLFFVQGGAIAAGWASRVGALAGPADLGP